MNIPLDRDKPTALPRQIQAHLERLIHERLLTPGMKLPATRELAQQLGVNRGTVALAYEELVATGWARAHVGQGTFVAERPASGAVPVTLPAAAPVALDWSGLFSRNAQILGADDERSRAVTPIPSSGAIVSFAGGMPDSGLFPTDAFRRVLNQVIREEGASLLQYYPAGGYPPLRQYLSTYLLRFGLEARPDEILIVNGSQQGFDLIARTLIDPGDFVAIEQPTYPRAMQVFRSFGAQLLSVPWDAAGPRCRLRADLIVSASRRTPSSIRPAATDENESRSVRWPPPSTKKGAPGVKATPRSIACRSRAPASMPAGSVSSSENPPWGSVQVTSGGMRRRSAASSIERRRAYSVATRVA